MNDVATPDRIQLVVQGLIMFIAAIALHEFGHAWMANRLGDSTPRVQGRLTLNPLAHADPIGTILLPLVFLISTGGLGFAWGKPVQHRSFHRKGNMLVAFAGPAMNVLLATFIVLVHVILLKAGVKVGPKLTSALVSAVFLNFILFFFNLIPAAPLDGGTVLRGLIPYNSLRIYDQYAVYAPFVLLAFMMIPAIGVVVRWPAEWMTFHLYEVMLKIGHVPSLAGAP